MAFTAWLWCAGLRLCCLRRRLFALDALLDALLLGRLRAHLRRALLRTVAATGLLRLRRRHHDLPLRLSLRFALLLLCRTLLLLRHALLLPRRYGLLPLGLFLRLDLLAYALTLCPLRRRLPGAFAYRLSRSGALRLLLLLLPLKLLLLAASCFVSPHCKRLLHQGRLPLISARLSFITNL